MRDFIVRNNVSVWLCFMVMIVAATMMHPSFASLLSIGVIAVLLIILRWVAHIEGSSL